MREIEVEQAKKTALYEAAKQIRQIIDDLVKGSPGEDAGELETEITRLVFED
jgi:hypothetical protein